MENLFLETLMPTLATLCSRNIILIHNEIQKKQLSVLRDNLAHYKTMFSRPAVAT